MKRPWTSWSTVAEVSPTILVDCSFQHLHTCWSILNVWLAKESNSLSLSITLIDRGHSFNDALSISSFTVTDMTSFPAQITQKTLTLVRFLWTSAPVSTNYPVFAIFDLYLEPSSNKVYCRQRFISYYLELVSQERRAYSGFRECSPAVLFDATQFWNSGLTCKEVLLSPVQRIFSQRTFLHRVRKANWQRGVCLLLDGALSTISLKRHQVVWSPFLFSFSALVLLSCPSKHNNWSCGC